MKDTQCLKLRIERNGKIQHRHLRKKDSLTLGRSPSSDVMVYGEEYPKKAEIFAPTAAGFELHLFGKCRGEVLKDNSRLVINDLLVHEVLPKRNGHHVLPLSSGKTGYVHFDDVKIDFAFENVKLENVSHKEFSIAHSFLNYLAADPLFRSILAVLMVSTTVLINYVRGIPYVPPKNDVTASEAIQRIARWVPKVEEPEPPKAQIGQVTEEVAQMDSKKDPTKDKELNSTKDREGRKEGFGPKRDDAGQGVNPENLGALGLLVGEGVADNSNDFIETMLASDLAQDLGQLMDNKTLTAGGRDKSGGVDVDALNAATRIGLGKGGGGAQIDEILNGVIGSTKSVNLQPKSRVEIAKIGRVSGSQEAVGARTEESLRRVLQDNMGRLQYLYEKYLKTNPDIGGKINLEVVISTSGAVASVKILQSDINLPAFQQDIINSVKRWKYDPISSGEVTVVYPIVFMKT